MSMQKEPFDKDTGFDWSAQATQSPLYQLPNPYMDENGWWWYDETEMPDGPYDTRAEAATVCDNYCREVLGLEC